MDKCEFCNQDAHSIDSMISKIRGKRIIVCGECVKKFLKKGILLYLSKKDKK